MGDDDIVCARARKKPAKHVNSPEETGESRNGGVHGDAHVGHG